MNKTYETVEQDTEHKYRNLENCLSNSRTVAEIQSRIIAEQRSIIASLHGIVTLQARLQKLGHVEVGFD